MEKEGIGTSKLSERLICLENGVVTDRNFGKKQALPQRKKCT